VQVLPTPAPTASAAASDPPRIVLLGGQIVGSTLQLAITYQANNAIASAIVAPAGANYFVRVTSPQPKTPSHPVQFTLSLAMPTNLAQLTANGLSTQIMVALEDAASHLSSLVAVNLSFQHPDGGTGAVAAANPGKVCSWSQPTTCLPDGTGLLVCAVDELSVQVVDCQVGPPAFRCATPDGGVAACTCPNRCDLEAKSCGKDSCGHDCGSCPAGSECDALGNCRARAKNGCADGTREGYTDLARYPTIAACEAWWDGTQSMRAPRSGLEWCGNSTGMKCTVPADACAPGWHVCMQSGWPADIRERNTYPSGAEAAATKFSWLDCTTGASHGHWYASASSSAYPGAGSCTAFPLGCYAEDVSGSMDTIACGDQANNGGCNGAIWTSYTQGIGNACGSLATARTDQNGVLCCQDPEVTGS
jgi:hypothetical protein